MDWALERNRRLAWAKYYAVRRDRDRIASWAAELAEWLDATDVDLPDAALDLIGAARAGVADHDRAIITRFVRFHLAQAVPA